MKKAVVLTMLCTLLYGCSGEKEANVSTERFEYSGMGAIYTETLKDNDTGCIYLIFGGSNSRNGITALLDENGQTVCGKKEGE